jgi:hypothetical protein
VNPPKATGGLPVTGATVRPAIALGAAALAAGAGLIAAAERLGREDETSGEASNG